jgi:antirestriction protein ArdC
MPSTKKQIDLYQQVTNKIISLLEQGVTPWRCGWNKYGFARNYATGHRYSGINALLMNLTPHPIPYFLSFNQAKQLGGSIRKGAKSEMVYFYTAYYKNEEGKTISQEEYTALCGMGEEPQRIAFLKYFRVFNIADVENITISIPEVILQEHKKITQCETIIHSHHNRPAFVFEDANRAYYNPVKDCINMPAIEQFTSAEEYYSCFFHELVHSTGHASRLNRKGITQPNSFGSKDYSKEELIAEIGASFLCAHTSIDRPEIVENSAAYLQGWLSVLKADKKLIFKAAAAAQKAVNFLLEDVPANP